MKIKEIIEKLQTFNPEAEVHKINNHMEKGRCVEELYNFNVREVKCSTTTREFIDAFDYIRYTSEITVPDENGTETRIIVDLY